jgi:metallo-beta-lactamase class B
MIMSEADWDMLDQTERLRGGPKPKRDMVAVDGQKLTLGDTTITMYITPGHTPGVISLLIPLKDGGKSHLAAIWGGTGMQWDVESYHNQAVRFRDIVEKSGADVLLSTHPQLDLSDIKLRLVERRKPGAPHPYVIGNDLVKANLTVAAECSAAAMLMPEEYQEYRGRPR